MNRFLPLFLFWIGFYNVSGQTSPCLAFDSIRVVVIGSSTAAGTGASVPDSAWVNRYRNYLQGINPANEVINLARGGYNTWKLMPDYFTPPSNRPSPDTLRNISHALRQNPDVIIINLPSNDAAIGTGINAQMSNFILMDSLASQVGVPFWVSTTQPRNGNQIFKNIQLGVRDSILSKFGSRAINFWQGIADTANNIHPNYDSGDGVHLNDKGHGILLQRMIASGLADSNLAPYSGIDLKALPPICANCGVCGSASQVISYSIQNQGAQNSSATLIAQLIRENLLSGQIDTFSQSINPILGCGSITIQENINLSTGGHWRFHSLISDPNDTILFNNRSTAFTLQLAGIPTLTFRDTLICPTDSIYLSASSATELRWFSDSQTDSSLHIGDSLFWPAQGSDSVFLQTFRGPFYNIGLLNSSGSSNIEWNGCMFNLIASADTIFIDSLNFTAGSNGDLAVEWRSLIGDYRGKENDSTKWSSPLRDSIYGSVIDSSYNLNFGTISVLPFDTLGVYLYLKNPNQRLAYQSAGQRKTYGDSIFQLEAGSGIAAHFSTIYQPRIFRGSFYYHFGENNQGQCQSERQLMRIDKQKAYLDLGKDSLHPINQELKIYLGSSFSNAQWNYSATGDSLLIPAFTYLLGDSIHIIVQAEDSLGCLAQDTLIISFTANFEISKNTLQSLHFYPNPNQGKLKIDNPLERKFRFEIIDAQGRLQFMSDCEDVHCSFQLNLQPGLYQLILREGNSTCAETLIIY